MDKWAEYLFTTSLLVLIILIIYYKHRKTINTFKDSIAYLNKIYNLLKNVQENKYFDFLLDYYECKSIVVSKEEMIHDILYKPYISGEEFVVNRYIDFNTPLCALDLKKKLFIYVEGNYDKESVLIEFNFILKRFRESYFDSNLYNIHNHGINSFIYKSIRYAFNNFGDY